MKNIVILGAGFAGVSTALHLSRRVSKNEASITLVDRHPYHLAHTYLYEVASSPEELTTLAQLKQSVVLPLEEVFAGTGVVLRQGTITTVDSEKQEVQLDHGILRIFFPRKGSRRPRQNEY